MLNVKTFLSPCSYRAINAGKFPSFSDTMKQVGGSYYVVREIVQELKYYSKMNSSNSMDEKLVKKEPFNESKLLTTETVKVLSGNTETANDRPFHDGFQLEILHEIDARQEHLEEKREQQAASCEMSLSKEAVTTSAPVSTKHKCDFSSYFKIILTVITSPYFIFFYFMFYKCKCIIPIIDIQLLYLNLLPSCLHLLYKICKSPDYKSGLYLFSLFLILNLTSILY